MGTTAQTRPPAMLEIDTIARLLSVSKTHVYRLGNSGELPIEHIKLGKAWRFPRNSVEKLFSDEDIFAAMQPPQQEVASDES